jgi:hypothetical protein
MTALTGNTANGNVAYYQGGYGNSLLYLTGRSIGLTGAKATSRVGYVAGPPPVGAVTFSLPHMALVATANIGAAVSVGMTLRPTLSIKAAVGNASVDTSGIRLPAPRLSISGFAGTVASVALALPHLSIATSSADGTKLRLGAPRLSIDAVTGVAGSVSLRRPSLSIVSTAFVPGIAGAALALPRPVLSIDAATGRSASVALQLRRLALAVSGHTGVVGKVALALPVLRFGANGYGPQVGIAQLTLPMLRLVATGRVSAGAPKTVAIHTETMALTQYDNFPFNSFAQFNGVTLGASADGLFALSGATDNGAAINAFARVGITDFGTSHLKRVDRIYVGYRADGDLVLRVLTDETQQRDYLLRAGASGLHGSHARLGRGVEARYWQFEVRNMNGADFDINTIELKPTTLRRRVGGRDA